MHDLNVLFFIVAAHIIDLTRLPMLQHDIDRLRMVLHIQPVADIFAVPIDRQCFSCQCIVDHERDQLLRELIGPVVI